MEFNYEYSESDYRHILNLNQTDVAAPFILTTTLTLPSRGNATFENVTLHKFEFNGVGQGFGSQAINNGDNNANWNEPMEIIFNGRSQNSILTGVLNASEEWQGLIGEFIMLEGYWDPAEMTGYLADKWGMQGLLPADHPYKSSAPTLPSFV